MSVPTVSSFIPTVSSLRADAHLAAQADLLVAGVEGSVPGNAPLINTIKRGLVRAGGDLSPSKKVLWPQDFILGSGKQIKLYYNDLSIYEWVSGYIATVQYEPNPSIAQFMMDHLRNLMDDAVYHGWEPVKAAHAVILTSMESGSLSWSDELRMAEKRRSAITRASQVKETPPPPRSQFQQRFTARQGYIGNGNNSRSSSAPGKKVIKTCMYFNNNVCARKGDHDEGTVFYRHVCSHCMSVEHTVKECPFLCNTI
jgi:hypothetical protein